MSKQFGVYRNFLSCERPLCDLVPTPNTHLPPPILRLLIEITLQLIRDKIEDERTTMIHVSLPDRATRTLSDDATASDLASDITKSLAKRTVAAVVNRILSDLAEPLPDGACVELIGRDDPRALELIRHGLTHGLAEAVQNIWRETKTAIWPAIEHGFYYDLDRETPFTPKDLLVIEKKMREIVATGTPFTCEVWTRDQAAEHFEEAGETWKLAVLDAKPEGERVKIYRQGEWLDLCPGPHMRHTGDVGTAFKQTRVAGAYWSGDAKNLMLSRIYGIAFADQEALDAHEKMMAKAEKRDHKRLGREHALKKTPIQIAVGAREAEDRTVSARRHGQKQTQTLQLEEAVAVLVEGAKSPRQS